MHAGIMHVSIFLFNGNQTDQIICHLFSLATPHLHLMAALTRSTPQHRAMQYLLISILTVPFNHKCSIYTGDFLHFIWPFSCKNIFFILTLKFSQRSSSEYNPMCTIKQQLIKNILLNFYRTLFGLLFNIIAHTKF